MRKLLVMVVVGSTVVYHVLKWIWFHYAVAATGGGRVNW